VLVQAGEGGLEVRRDQRQVGARRDGRLLLVHQVDLRSFVLEPGEARRQRGRRLDPLEAEQGEELDGVIDVAGPQLDSNVLEHREGTEIRAGRVRLPGEKIYEAVNHVRCFVRYGEQMDAAGQSWSDARLDDLSRRVDTGFTRVDADLRALNARFDSFQSTMLQVGGGVIVALIGLIATQL
jgi:hypothetical protein